MKLKFLNESVYEVRISRVMTDKSLRPVDTVFTTIDDSAPNPDRQAIRNAIYRYGRRFGLSYGDVVRGFRAEVVGRGKKVSQRYVNCRSCGLYRPVGPQGDTCVECNPD
jgi:hypothetical protein